MKKKVIAAGHICLDITPVFQSENNYKLSDILSPGKLVHTDAADIHTGGSAANTGLAMKLLGADVSIMGKIGKDPFGEIICSILKKYDSDKDILFSEKDSTSYSIVLAVPGTDRIFLHNPGANDSFCADDIPLSALQDASLFHFGYPPLMESVFKDNGKELISIMKKAKNCGAATSLDFASIDPSSKAGQADWKKILEHVIPFVDFLVPSAEELCFMLDPKRLSTWIERAGNRDITEILDIENDIMPLANQCMELGAKVLLIKCGVKGIYYQISNRKVLQGISSRIELDSEKWADKSGFEKSFVPDRILSGTGAGDISIAGFLTAVLNGCGPEESVQFAAAAGACCVTSYDALSGLKSMDEMKQKIENGWAKLSF